MLYIIACIAATVALLACGGGAGFVPPSKTGTPALTASPRPSVASTVALDARIEIGGGVSLHLRCTAGTGQAVILDADLNGDTSEFEFVIPKLRPSMHACAYDRAGEGSSSAPSRQGRSSADIASELRALVAAAGLARPFVLVGNHFGGLFDLRYAAMYHTDVDGLVLLDPMLPTSFSRFHADCAGIPTDPNNEAIDRCALLNEAASAVLRPPDVPLVIVSAADNPGWPPEEFAVWLQSHRDLAASVTKGRQFAVDSDLVIPREQPDATVQAIEDVVNALTRP